GRFRDELPKREPGRFGADAVIVPGWDARDPIASGLPRAGRDGAGGARGGRGDSPDTPPAPWAERVPAEAARVPLGARGAGQPLIADVCVVHEDTEEGCLAQRQAHKPEAPAKGSRT